MLFSIEKAVLGAGVYVTQCHPQLIASCLIGWNVAEDEVCRVVPLVVRTDQVLWLKSGQCCIGKIRGSEAGLALPWLERETHPYDDLPSAVR